MWGCAVLCSGAGPCVCAGMAADLTNCHRPCVMGGLLKQEPLYMGGTESGSSHEGCLLTALVTRCIESCAREKFVFRNLFHCGVIIFEVLVTLLFKFYLKYCHSVMMKM